jgi:predicted TIM-barrel enzyme
VLAGVNGTDPFLIHDDFLRRLIALGFSGIQNFPTVGLIDGNFRANLEATGMGYHKEVEAIAVAHELDLYTSPYVFDADDAREMVKAGADQIVAHVGLTTAGTIGAGVALSLDEAIDRVMTIAEAGRSLRPDLIVLCHGGPFDEPQNVGEALRRMPAVNGFFGASSIERLPTERAIKAQVEEFKHLELPKLAGAGV